MFTPGVKILPIEASVDTVSGAASSSTLNIKDDAFQNTSEHIPPIVSTTDLEMLVDITL